MIICPAFTTLEKERVLAGHLFTGSIINVYFNVRYNAIYCCWFTCYDCTAEKPLTNVNSCKRSAANNVHTYARIT